MEQEVARRIVGALRAHADRASAQAVVGGWAWLGASPEFTLEEFVTTGWADTAARDLAYEAANVVNDVLGLETFSGPHGGNDARARFARTIAWRIQDIVRTEFRSILDATGWETEFPPEE